MASFYLSLNRGELEQAGNLFSGTTTAGDDIKLRMDSGKNLTRKDVLLAIELFEMVLQGNTTAGSATPGQFLPPL